MRVVVAGKGWMAVRTARLLGALVDSKTLDISLEIVRNADDNGVDTWFPSLRGLAMARGWQIHESSDSAALGPDDVFISLQHDRIVKVAGLHGAAAYNLHFAYLPKYRGSVTSALPIRHGETQVGVTLHVLVQGIDAGPIVAQRPFELAPFYSAYDLYQLYHQYGFELVKDNLPLLLRGDVPSVPQDDAAATTFVRRDFDFSVVELTDFDRTAEEVRDWYRSLIYPPVQLPVFQNRKVASCYALHWDGPADLTAGTVVAEDSAQAIVACRDGMVALEFLDQ